MLDDRSYGLGWDDGYQRGHDQGYMRGWEDCERSCVDRIAKLHAEIRLMEAQVAVLTRRIENADEGHK